MSYLQKALGPSEKLLSKAKVHWIVYVGPIFWMIVGFALMGAIGSLGLFIVLPALFALLGGIIYSISTDLAVTDKKVLAKWGLISRRTIEQRLTKVDTVQVDQSILGRLLNYGSIVVTGSGVSTTPIKSIADPMGFRRAVETAEEKAKIVE